MKGYLIYALILLGISLFCGIIVISIGMGSVFPKMNLVAKPFVCSKGELQLDQYVGHYRPGETSWSITAYCIDSTTHAKKNITGRVQLVAGVVYSAIPFVLLVLLNFFVNKRAEKNPGQPASRPGRVDDYPRPHREPVSHKESNSLEKKLEKLKELRESDLITEEDYQKKKEKLLDSL